MKSQNGKRVVLVVLVAVLCLTAVQAYRINRPQAAAPVEPVQSVQTAAAPAAPEGRIRLDLIDGTASTGNVGRNNLFQYRAGRAAAQPGPNTPVNPVIPPPVAQPPISTPLQPPPPPPPPPIPLKYQGFALLDPAQGILTAFLSDDIQHFNVKEGDVLMGRFRIGRISNAAIDVEDLEYKRRQTLPLLK